VALDGRDEPALLALAASLARGLDGPMTAAILESARELGIHIEDADWCRGTTGMGVAASVAGHTVVLGNSELFTNLGLSIESLGTWPERLRHYGQHVLFVAVDGRTAGFLGLADAGV
jgi:cation transport ATPase